MKKKAVLRGMLGVPLGIAIGYLITVVISVVWGQGYYVPCVPQLIQRAGNEINAVMLQTVICGLVGAGFAASSVIWEIEQWNIVKQTGLYFLVAVVIMMPISYLMYWMEHSVWGFFIYFGIFTAIFIVVWLVQYLIWKRSIKKMNARLG